MSQTHKQKYVQEYILRLIKNGLRIGDILPSTKTLSLRLNVSCMTINRGMTYLEEIGAIRRIRGKGTFVGSYELRQTGLPQYHSTSAENDHKVITFLSPFQDAPFMADFIRGIEDILDKSKYILHNQHVYIEKTHEELVLSQAAENSTGIVFISSYPPAMQHVLRKLVEKNYPIVLLDRWPNTLFCHSVAMDNTSAVMTGMKELYNCGHRRIFYYGGNNFNYSSTQLRINAYTGFMEKHHLKPFIFNSESELLSFMERYPRDWPTAIFINHDILAERLLETFTRMHIRIPEDISMIMISSSTPKEKPILPITSIVQPKYELGMKAIELLQHLIKNHESTYIRYYLPGTIRYSNSIKNIPTKEQ